MMSFNTPSGFALGHDLELGAAAGQKCIYLYSDFESDFEFRFRVSAFRFSGFRVLGYLENYWRHGNFIGSFIENKFLPQHFTNESEGGV